MFILTVASHVVRRQYLTESFKLLPPALPRHKSMRNCVKSGFLDILGFFGHYRSFLLVTYDYNGMMVGAIVSLSRCFIVAVVTRSRHTTSLRARKEHRMIRFPKL
jgi:hypothetical protein